MASVFGHGILAYTLSKAIDKRSLTQLTILAILSSILPDIDVLTFNYGIPYEHMFGHRGFTHSILFAVFWALLLTFIFGRRNKTIYFMVLFLATCSHGVLDAMTTGGRGVGFLIPFSEERFFFPIRKIVVSPLKASDFFSEWGIEVILSELKYIFFPCGIILVVLSFIKRRNEN